MNAIDLLAFFNLTRQESTIYTTLYYEGNLTGYEVAKKTGISRSNAYTSLASLVDKGAAYIIEDTATRYTPVKIEEFCENKIRQLNQFKQELLTSMPKIRNESEGYITIKGEENILDKMKNMLNQAKERVYLSVSNRTLEIVLGELENGILKGLKIVIVTDKPFELKGATVYYAIQSQYQIRLIADSSNVLTGNTSEGINSTCLYSKNKNLVEIFKDSLKNEIQLIKLMKGKC